MASLSHRQGWSFAVLLTIFPCVFFASTNNDDPSVTYRTSTSEVRVTFFATDANNRLVETLDKDDFAVVDGEMVIRDFRSLTRSNETALDIVLLIDASESVAPRFQALAQDALRLVAQTHTHDDVSIITFAGLRPSLLCSGDCSTATTERRLMSVKPAGATPLFDALAFAAQFSSKRDTAGRRRVLIVYSDGADTISTTSSREALELISASGALLYAVNLHAEPDSRGNNVLQQMTDATGGRSFSIQCGAANVLPALMADLRASYVVTYELPRRLPGFHSLRILPKHDLNLRFHCRRGYFYEENR